MSESHNVQVTLRDGMFMEGYTSGDPQSDRFPIPLDSDDEFGGQGKGVRPVRLLLVAVAGCMAMDVASILRKKRQEFTGLDVRVVGDHADDHPKIYKHITVKFIVTGKQIDPEAVERAVELSFTRYCPSSNLLKLAVPIETSYEIIDE